VTTERVSTLPDQPESQPTKVSATNTKGANAIESGPTITANSSQQGFWSALGVALGLFVSLISLIGVAWALAASLLCLVIFVWGASRDRAWVSRFTGDQEPPGKRDQEPPGKRHGTDAGLGLAGKAVRPGTGVKEGPGDDGYRTKDLTRLHRHWESDAWMWKHQPVARVAYAALPFAAALCVIGGIFWWLRLGTVPLGLGLVFMLVVLPLFVLDDLEYDVRRDGLTSTVRAKILDGGPVWTVIVGCFSLAWLSMWFAALCFVLQFFAGRPAPAPLQLASKYGLMFGGVAGAATLIVFVVGLIIEVVKDWIKN
jgi:hypothetical protein